MHVAVDHAPLWLRGFESLPAHIFLVFLCVPLLLVVFPAKQDMP